MVIPSKRTRRFLAYIVKGPFPWGALWHPYSVFLAENDVVEKAGFPSRSCIGTVELLMGHIQS